MFPLQDKVIGVLDWELSTLGNQMCDVAYSTLVPPFTCCYNSYIFFSLLLFFFSFVIIALIGQYHFAFFGRLTLWIIHQQRVARLVDLTILVDQRAFLPSKNIWLFTALFRYTTCTSNTTTVNL